LTHILNTLDSNGDGRVSRDEWLAKAAELPALLALLDPTGPRATGSGEGAHDVRVPASLTAVSPQALLADDVLQRLQRAGAFLLDTVLLALLDPPHGRSPGWSATPCCAMVRWHSFLLHALSSLSLPVPTSHFCPVLTAVCGYVAHANCLDGRLQGCRPTCVEVPATDVSP
jgi:hypothetical protein